MIRPKRGPTRVGWSQEEEELTEVCPGRALCPPGTGARRGAPEREERGSRPRREPGEGCEAPTAEPAGSRCTASRRSFC